MKQYFINKNSENLLILFAGWGCDEFEFQHLLSKDNVLILYEYLDLNFEFDFSKYKEINLIAFSAGVFIASLFDFDFKINKKIALDGNPYLFDEKLGLSKGMIEIFRGLNEDNCLDFAKKYIVKTKEELKIYNPGKRTLENCFKELDCLEKIYNDNKDRIKDTYNVAIFGDEDKIFQLENQKTYYKDRLKLVKNAYHNIFFKIKSYEDIFDIAKN